MNSDIMERFKKLHIPYTDHDKYVKFTCINPVHADNNPSMTMLKENGFCKCWSCGATYSFNAFLKTLGHEELQFDKKKILSNQFKQSLQNDEILNNIYIQNKFNRELRMLYGKLLNPYRNVEVMKYLESININSNMIDYFDIRYVDKAEITFTTGHKGTFIKDRICIPIVEDGKIVNIECRDFTDKQKLKVIYPKGSKADILWNIDTLDFTKPLIVVEGIKSALRIWRYINKNVTATLGSALGSRQRKLLQKAKHLIVFPDHDNAGKQMTRQVLYMMDNDFRIAYMEHEGEDPADNTLQAVENALNNSIESVDYFLHEHNIDISSRSVSWSSVS